MGDIKDLTRFTKEMFDAISWETVGKLQPGRLEDMAEFIFVLVAVEPADFGSALVVDAIAIRFGQRSGDGVEKAVSIVWQGEGLFLRGHFAVGNTVVDQDPLVEIRRI
ncbi:hypothetical protein OAH36_04675 [Verrucomicrobia bacterium]|nr:hypothetical protein [Verrucomicrobiota bacterium]